jgi:hypothetical protein
VNPRTARKLQAAGVALVLGSYAVEVVSRRLLRTRIALDTVRIHAQRRLYEPGALVAILGEGLMTIGTIAQAQQERSSPARPPAGS